MGFLDNYETVNMKVKRLHSTYPTNRIETSIIDWQPEKGFILIECRIYRHYEDEKPAAIDYAHGMVGAFNAQMKRWYVEDTVSSAIGRCASVVLGTDEKPSRENMEQVEHSDAALAKAANEDPWAISLDVGMPNIGSAIDAITDKIGAEVLAEAPRCVHGSRIWREGTSQKTGKAWANFSCTEKSKASQCDPLWYVMTSGGTWKPQI